MKNKSWKTTTLGILTILIALFAAGKAMLEGGSVDVNVLLAQVMLGIGLITAKDAGVTGGTVAATPEAAARVQLPGASIGG